MTMLVDQISPFRAGAPLSVLLHVVDRTNLVHLWRSALYIHNPSLNRSVMCRILNRTGSESIAVSSQ